MTLQDSIEILKHDLQQLLDYYLTHEKPEDKRDRSFFEYVRKETTPIYNKIKGWEEEALDFVKNRDVRVHPQQVASTAENLELILMHSYYVDVRKKRYMELYKSIEYVFELLMEDLQTQKT
ncbi:YppE family protein [Radiobacillus kanasensis]|uniref:DUF1798 family protein n=1 Tax=Radiobacillus kanasensis TaxID=2844358 RepID=UPI001E60ED93|nr:DUF1798 family protein [Radiobacillus kanasensis]UFU01268.1 YppE family protein [Radiobacillus kanasensis]